MKTNTPKQKDSAIATKYDVINIVSNIKKA